MTTLVQCKPGPALDPYVEWLWYYEADGARPAADRLLPHGAFELVVSLDESIGTARASLIAGPQSKAIVVDPASYPAIVGAHFKPGGAAALLRHNAREFSNRDVALADIWPAQVDALQQRSLESSTPENAIRSLESALKQHVDQAPAPHPAVARAIADFHSPLPRKRIRDLIEESGLSQRRFIEIFKNEIGLTPKLYARIRRLQRALRWMNATHPVDWADLAFSCGYADQAHFIREFREFTGMRPTEYRSRWPDNPNHVPLVE